jgi:hypothetical protein
MRVRSARHWSSWRSRVSTTAEMIARRRRTNNSKGRAEMGICRMPSRSLRPGSVLPHLACGLLTVMNCKMSDGSTSLLLYPLRAGARLGAMVRWCREKPVPAAVTDPLLTPIGFDCSRSKDHVSQEAKRTVSARKLQ